MDTKESKSKSGSKDVTIKIKLNVRTLTITVISVVLLLAAFGLGWHFGAEHQKTQDKNGGFAVNGGSQTFARHRAIVGTISSVSKNSITVKQANNQNQSASISSSTVIRSTKAQSISATSLKTGDKVIVTASVNSNGSLAAQNILEIQ